MTDLIEKLPGPPDKPVEEWTIPELLNENVRRGLMQNLAIISQPLKLKTGPDDVLTDQELKLQRVISAASDAACRLLARIQVATMQQTQDDDNRWDAMLKTIAEIEAKGKPTR